jgi:hypothetical protein
LFAETVHFKKPTLIAVGNKLLKQVLHVVKFEVLLKRFFSSKLFDGNPLGVADSLRNTYFKTNAEIPDMDWLK